jgi:hypothetical protein
MTASGIKLLIAEQEKVKLYNKDYGIGQPVIVSGIKTTTSSRAFLLHGKIAGVYCGELRGFFPLDSVEIFKP